MPPQLPLIFSIVSLAAAGAYIYKPVRLVRVGGIVSTVYWTTRSWLWNYPVTPDYNIWEEGDINEYDRWRIQRKRIVGIWKYLRPFFSSRGYDLHDHIQQPFNDLLVPQQNGVSSNQKSHHPYAKSLLLKDMEAEFSLCSPFVWAARDKDGQDVMIKALSGATPTRELKAYRLLQSEPLCDDPRNPAIPILEYLEFNQQVFAVMPRWSSAFVGDFVKVGEIIRCGRAFLEAVAFLHENKIGHGDIRPQNMYMDILVPYNINLHIAGVYGPERKYALIDFESAALPAEDGTLSPLFERTAVADLRFLSKALEIKFRCIETIVPEVIELLHSMQLPNPPTATECIYRYNTITNRLTAEDLDLPVEAVRWRHGQFYYREGPPIYREIS